MINGIETLSSNVQITRASNSQYVVQAKSEKGWEDISFWPRLKEARAEAWDEAHRRRISFPILPPGIYIGLKDRENPVFFELKRLGDRWIGPYGSLYCEPRLCDYELIPFHAMLAKWRAS